LSLEVFLLGLKDPVGFFLIRDLPGLKDPVGFFLIRDLPDFKDPVDFFYTRPTGSLRPSRSILLIIYDGTKTTL